MALFLWAFACCLSLYDRGTVYTSASPVAGTQTSFDWNKASTILEESVQILSYCTDPCQLTPSTSLNWTPCFENYTCTRLKVPLDYKNPSVGSTAIAFIKLAAQNNSGTAPNLLINQGIPP